MLTRTAPSWLLAILYRERSELEKANGEDCRSFITEERKSYFISVLTSKQERMDRLLPSDT